jgi:CO/xanthine dehydrogenase Mo-binding subunit
VTGSPSLSANPLLSDWIDFDVPGVVTARTGKVEFGQGIRTALVQIVADALTVDSRQVRLAATTTGSSPDEGFTAGSMSIQHSGVALLQVCQQIRALFSDAARSHLAVHAVSIAEGVFSAGSMSTTYWDLAAEVILDRPADPTASLGGIAGEIGTSAPRLDLADKVLGIPRYLQDLRLPDQVYGRVLHPPARGSVLLALDPAPVTAMPGVLEVVIDGSFVGVVATSEYLALRAVAALAEAASWSPSESTLTDAGMSAFITAAPHDDTVLSDVHDGPVTDPASADGTSFTARYSRPFLAHASIAPSCAAALLGPEAEPQLTVWTHSQGIYPLRAEIARATGIAAEAITVTHVEGAGCYGHNAADDVAYEAVLLARTMPGRPVHVTWSREDELGWGPFGAAMVVEITSTCASDGTLESWTTDAWGNGHSSRPGTLPTPAFLAYSLQENGNAIPPSGDPAPAAGSGTGRNAVPPYRVARTSVTARRITQMPIRASALRSLGAHLNVFAAESHVDDMAAACGADPLEYRLRHLDDDRGRAVLERVAEMSNWGTRPTVPDSGRGMGYARYKNKGAWCAVVADVEADESVRLLRMWIAVDAGLVVNPDGVVNQIEGGAIQSASWTLHETVRFSGGRVLSDTWETYPILTFSQIPMIDVAIVDRRDRPPLGAGEASVGPTAAALGNAVFDALGVRVRTMPISTANIIAAMPD